MSAVERVDPDDLTSMALPVIGDTVTLSDGATGYVSGRLRRVTAPDVWRVETAVGPTRYVTLDQIIGYPEDDGTEAEALADVEVPRFAPPSDADYSAAPFPDVTVHGRAPAPSYSQAGLASLVTR